MRAVPFHHCEFLSREDIHIYECSDRILIPKSVYVSMGFSEGPILLHISHKTGKSVSGTLHNIHDCGKDDILYIPTWMIHTLAITENLTIACAPRHVCNKISLRPHNSDLLIVSDWHLKFAASIRSYNTLTIGTCIPLVIGNKYMFMTINALNDSKHSTYYLVSGNEIDIEILESLESTLESTQETCKGLSYLYKDPGKHNETYIARPFIGASYVLGGEPINRPLRELAAEAAQKRHQKLKEYNHIVGNAEL